MSSARARQVSFDDEPLICVDEENNVLEYRPKADVHAGDGILHRAFSIFLFNEAGEVLIQRRAAGKPLWPGFWANACCSHPRRGETEAEAAVRRLTEELGIEAVPEYVYTFTYHARYEDIGSEHEVCSVFLARSDAPVIANESEVAELAWVTPAELDARLRDTPDEYSPWLKLEWARLRSEYGDRLAAYGAV
ncbi:MAG: isopentenyl-diphosphate Delta-isomerase [Planctomycetota bacterium]|nr:isopentenyl-diphosphate Delta-isomerase [Planctomycetota bacterium]